MDSASTGRRGLHVDINGSGVRYFLGENEFVEFLDHSRPVSPEFIRRAKRWDQRRVEREVRRSETLSRGRLDILKLPDGLWRELDVGLVPDENHWPSILFADSSHSESSEYGRCAIESLLEYLRNRKIAARSADITARRSLHRDT